MPVPPPKHKQFHIRLHSSSAEIVPFSQPFCQGLSSKLSQNGYKNQFSELWKKFNQMSEEQNKDSIIHIPLIISRKLNIQTS